MNRTTYAFTTACLFALALAAPAQALHCNGTIITIDAEAATFYVDDRSDPGDPFNIWLYLESNGVEGLQSGSDVICPSIWCDPTLPWSFMDRCDHAAPDTQIF